MAIVLSIWEWLEKTSQGVRITSAPNNDPREAIDRQRQWGNECGFWLKVMRWGPTLYYGPGAGAEPTASSVVADIIDVARMLDTEPRHRVPLMGFQADALKNTPILDIGEIETAYYLRMSALDKPGVLSSVAQVLSNAGISIEAIIQKEPLEGQVHVPLIILTSRSIEHQLVSAIAEIEALDSIYGEIIRIRVESLG